MQTKFLWVLTFIINADFRHGGGMVNKIQEQSFMNAEHISSLCSYDKLKLSAPNLMVMAVTDLADSITSCGCCKDMKYCLKINLNP